MDLIRRNCFSRSSEVPEYPRYEHVDPPLRLEPLERMNSNISELSTPSPSSSVITMSPCTPTPSPRDITGGCATDPCTPTPSPRDITGGSATDQLENVIDNVESIG
jgi:hypothetical protein